ncbi:mRNA splicing protein [Pichia californica]|uniref:Pre-mRNA-splicing factor SLU7 n=1 Tax=Pichia californica TaxID=460514 RepID=A0A9P6WG65_9ASCO|nr:mRNA splicing protein [[Candida] californica]KAG0686589.1 mRNA splicing protein [[Candida] californica]
MSGKKPAQSGPPNKKTYVDSSTGRKINDYIPKFISTTPWYYSNNSLKIDSQSRKRKTDDELYKELTDKSNDRLKHQRLNPGEKIIPNNEARKGLGINDEFDVIIDNDDNDNEENINKEKKNFDEMISKESWRKKVREWKKRGRCENCGGKHSKSECLEKPHTISFIYRNDNEKDNKKNNNKTILVKKDTNDWDEKRDRWRGIDINEEYSEIMKNLKKKEEKLLKDFKEDEKDEISKDNLPADETEILIKAVMKNNPLAQDPSDSTFSRSLAEKPRYLEVIKTGEELRYNPKSRVYKDLKEGYLNERGQFIPYLTGEAAEFEKMKKFTRSVQSVQKKKWVDDKESIYSVTNKEYATEISPTTAMLKMKEKEDSDNIIREAKRKELLEKYGAY